MSTEKQLQPRSGLEGQSGRQMVGRGSIYTFAASMQMVAAALVVPFVTRTMEPEQYGLVALALALYVVYAALCTLGVPTPLTLVFFQREDGRRRARQLAVSAIGLATAVALALTVGSLIAGELVGSEEFFPLFALLPLIAIPEAENQSLLAILRAEDRPRAFVAMSITRSIGAQVLALISLLVFEPTALAYVGGYGLGILLATVLGFALVGTRHVGPAPHEIVRYSLRKGIPTLPHLIALFALATGDRILIALLGDTTEVARYQIAYTVGALPVTMLVAMNNAWMASVFGAAEERRWGVLSRSSSVLIAIAGFAIAGYALVAPVGVRILAPASYGLDGLADISILVALSAIPYIVFLAAGHVVNWHGRTGVLGWVTPVSVAFNFALLVALYPLLGILGAGLATLLAVALQALLAGRRARALQRIPVDTRGRRAAVLGVSAAAVVSLASALLPTTDLALIVRCLLALPLFLLAAAVLIERAGFGSDRWIPAPLAKIGRRLAPPIADGTGGIAGA